SDLIVRYWSDDLPDWQRVFLRKLHVTFVMSRNTHDRARAILHQDIIRHPHRQCLAAERIDREYTGVDSFFLFLTDFTTGRSLASYFLCEGFDVWLQRRAFE